MALTDKHRLVWMIETTKLSSIDNVLLTFEEGRLHLIKAAARSGDTTCMKLEPAVPAGGDYVAVALDWVGHLVYQHTA